MKKWIFILSGLLAVQLVLAAVLNLTGEDYGAFQAEEKLLSFNRQAVDGLRIEDGTDSVVLKKQEGISPPIAIRTTALMRSSASKEKCLPFNSMGSSSTN